MTKDRGAMNFLRWINGPFEIAMLECDDAVGFKCAESQFHSVGTKKTVHQKIKSWTWIRQQQIMSSGIEWRRIGEWPHKIWYITIQCILYCVAYLKCKTLRNRFHRKSLRKINNNPGAPQIAYLNRKSAIRLNENILSIEPFRRLSHFR